MFNKKGQREGLAVMYIIGVIIAMTVVFIIIMPVETREALLNQSSESTTITDSQLLSISPGELNPEGDSISEYTIPNVNIYLKEEPEITQLSNKLTVHRAWFSQKYPTLKFTIDELTNLKEANLFLSTTLAKGDLVIYLNGKLIHSEELDTGIQTIKIPRDYLEQDNEIILQTDFPIWPWSKKDYTFSEISLKQNYELINAKEERTFILPEEEIENIEQAELEYNQFCNLAPKTSSDLSILLNDKEIYSGELFCVTTEENIDLPVTYLKEENTLTFITEAGDFMFSSIDIRTQTTEGSYSTNHFKLSSSQFDSIEAGDKDIYLDMTFTKKKEKKATLLINNHQININTEDPTYTLNIEDYVVSGTNIIKIVPISKINIVAMTVNLA